MADERNPDPPDDEEDIDLDDLPGLRAVARMARLVPTLPWFTNVGQELDEDEIEWAEAYLSALGFPGAEIVPVIDWEEAETSAQNPDWDTAWWEAEEQMRVALIAEACDKFGEDAVMVALTHMASQASETVQAAAETVAMHHGVIDEALIRAAAGAATQACYQAALVLAAEVEDEHPFAIKFRLYESGRWPLALVGNSFHLF